MGKKDQKIYELKRDLRTERTRVTNLRSENTQLNEVITLGGLGYIAERREQLAESLLYYIFDTGEGITWFQMPDNVCGVYFLVAEEKIIYIGQSKNMFDRITSHRRSDKTFDQVRYLTCKQTDLCRIEDLMIKLIRPPLNMMGNPSHYKNRSWSDKDIGGIHLGELGLS